MKLQTLRLQVPLLLALAVASFPLASPSSAQTGTGRGNYQRAEHRRVVRTSRVVHRTVSVGQRRASWVHAYDQKHDAWLRAARQKAYLSRRRHVRYTSPGNSAWGHSRRHHRHY